MKYDVGVRVRFEAKERDDPLVGTITRQPTRPEPWYLIDSAGTWCIDEDAIVGRYDPDD